MKKNRKRLAVFGLIALCAILTAGVFMLGQSRKDGDVLPSTDELGIETAQGGADGDAAPGAISALEVKLDAIPSSDATADEQSGNDIPLTVITDKPEPPALPDTANTGGDKGDATPEDVEAHEALDPALKNPDTKPDVTPAPVEPAKPADGAPEAGDKNGNGEVYIPGFGWVKDEGGGGQGQQSQLDPDHADFDKIIGY